MDTPIGAIDCACVIHGNTYSWTYVERLYNMLSRHLTPLVKLHVYTEADRAVPEPYIKHTLTDWGISGPKKSWWYKIQLFNTEHHRGSLLYFDLDTIIVDNVDWICRLPTASFWAVQDFKYLWRPGHSGINSSVMWWDTTKFSFIWENFQQSNRQEIMKKYRGDQDFISHVLSQTQLRFLDTERIKSWRWQCLNGGYNFSKRTYQNPDSGTQIPKDASILVFHGHPKPHEIEDSNVVCHWG